MIGDNNRGFGENGLSWEIARQASSDVINPAGLGKEELEMEKAWLSLTRGLENGQGRGMEMMTLPIIYRAHGMDRQE